MNQILKLIEKREVYNHIILFKIYLETKGNTDSFYGGNLRKDIHTLIGDDFTNEDFHNAEQYLQSSGYLRSSMSSCLTVQGRDYFERWIKDFGALTNEDKELLNKKLSAKAIAFLGITKDVAVTVGSVVKVVELLTK